MTVPLNPNSNIPDEPDYDKESDRNAQINIALAVAKAARKMISNFILPEEVTEDMAMKYCIEAFISINPDGGEVEDIWYAHLIGFCKGYSQAFREAAQEIKQLSIRIRKARSDGWLI